MRLTISHMPATPKATSAAERGFIESETQVILLSSEAVVEPGNGGPPVLQRKLSGALLVPAILVLLMLVGACNRRERSATATGTAENPSIRTDTTPAALNDSIPAATPDSGLSDANIVALLDEANKADSAAGAYAAPKASTASRPLPGS